MPNSVNEYAPDQCRQEQIEFLVEYFGVASLAATLTRDAINPVATILSTALDSSIPL